MRGEMSLIILKWARWQSTQSFTVRITAVWCGVVWVTGFKIITIQTIIAELIRHILSIFRVSATGLSLEVVGCQLLKYSISAWEIYWLLCWEVIGKIRTKQRRLNFENNFFSDKSFIDVWGGRPQLKLLTRRMLMLVVCNVESKYKYNDQQILSPPTDCITGSRRPTSSTYLNLKKCAILLCTYYLCPTPHHHWLWSLSFPIWP